MPTPEAWLAQPYEPIGAEDVVEEWTAVMPSTYDDDTRADIIVQAYDALDLRIIADMEGGH